MGNAGESLRKYVLGKFVDMNLLKEITQTTMWKVPYGRKFWREFILADC